MFQSSPTPKGGRYTSAISTPKASRCFNPRPPRKVGATHQHGLRQHGRECFNPRPPRKVGATFRSPWMSVIIIVSILAHPERWALRSRCYPGSVISLFQSSPTPKGGRYVVEKRAGAVVIQGFNPRPPRKVGATPPPPVACVRNRCFNPRPPRKVGATQVPYIEGEITDVSILAHPERWALRSRLTAGPCSPVFQSSPTPKGGRYIRRITQHPE